MLQLSLPSTILVDRTLAINDLSFITSQDLATDIIAIPAIEQTSVPESRMTTVLVLGFLGVLLQRAKQNKNV